jgi:uncharacterized repeat protein (TIGR03803 family)
MEINTRSLTQRPARIAIAVFALFCALITAATPLAQAQTYTILHNFSGGSEGSGPVAGLTLDAAGNLYGVAGLGGSHCGDSGCGTVFELVRHGSGWIVKKVYDFTGDTDGAFPDSGVVFGPDGSLYGTTNFLGPFNNGAIYQLRPPDASCQRVFCPWLETTLYNFTGGADGGLPEGDVTFDQAVNLYGTTSIGGTGTCDRGCGVVWELSPSGGAWNYSVIYSFASLADGALPNGGLFIDNDGNVYGTTGGGGAFFDGTVFKLTKTGSTWSKTVLHDFAGGSDGSQPQGGVTPDAGGNLYGFTFSGGDQGNGTAYRLHPVSGGWEYSVLLTFPLHSAPVGNPLLDSDGNLYGSAFSGGADRAGAIFKLTAGSWNYVSLHDFTRSDGSDPLGSLIFDASGNLYGTAAGGGAHRAGVAFQIAQ